MDSEVNKIIHNIDAEVLVLNPDLSVRDFSPLLLKTRGLAFSDRGRYFKKSVNVFISIY